MLIKQDSARYFFEFSSILGCGFSPEGFSPINPPLMRIIVPVDLSACFLNSIIKSIRCRKNIHFGEVDTEKMESVRQEEKVKNEVSERIDDEKYSEISTVERRTGWHRRQRNEAH